MLFVDAKMVALFTTVLSNRVSLVDRVSMVSVMVNYRVRVSGQIMMTLNG